MKRLYLCPVVQEPNDRGELTYVSLAGAYRLRGLLDGQVRNLIPSDASGRPARAWSLAVVDASDHTPLLADAQLVPLPAKRLAARLADDPDERDRLVAALQQRFGFGAGELAGLERFGDVVRLVGRRLEPTFRETLFDPD